MDDGYRAIVVCRGNVRTVIRRIGVVIRYLVGIGIG